MDAAATMNRLFAHAERWNVLVTFQLRAHMGHGEYGRPVYGDAQTGLRGIWSEERQQVRNAEGQEVVSRGNLVIRTPPIVKELDEITMADSSQPIILSVGGLHAATTQLFQRIFF